VSQDHEDVIDPAAPVFCGASNDALVRNGDSSLDVEQFVLGDRVGRFEDPVGGVSTHATIGIASGISKSICKRHPWEIFNPLKPGISAVSEGGLEPPRP
jgi:hypothetical protein